MYRVFGFLTKRDGLSLPEFKDYYENHHVPLLLSKAPKPPGPYASLCEQG